MPESDPTSPTPSAQPARIPFRRSYMGMIALQVLGRYGALAGLCWVALLGVLAVFAPFIASSHPLVYHDGERTWSPLLEHLTPTDVTLVVMLVVTAALAFIPRLRAANKLWIWSGALTVTAITCVLLVTPPQTVVYSQYRETLATNPDAWAVHTLIPFSPTDRLRDASVDTRLVGPGARPTDPDVAREIIRATEAKTGLKLSDLITSRAIDTSSARKQLNLPPSADPADPSKPGKLSDKNEAKILAITLAEARASRTQAMDVAAQMLAHYATLETGIPARAKETQRRIDGLAALPLHTRVHLMGTTAAGEDLASRMIHAARIALAVGFIATGIAVAIGVVVGGIMGYFSGGVDLLGMRAVEIFAAIPTIFLLIMVVAFYGRNLYLMMVIIGLTGWVGYALYVRAEFLKLRQQDFVQAAIATGAPLWSVLFRHMLPNGIAPVLVGASFGVAGAILTESTLSFIGLGLVEEPSWGQMLSQAREADASAWWIAVYPGAAIFLTVFAYNLVGEALRDAIDPRTQKR